MRTRSLTCAACFAIFAGGAAAQNVPDKFLVTGKAAERIQDFRTINLDTARRIAETCEALVIANNQPQKPAAADKAGGATYGVQINGEAPQQTVMILDAAGNHVYFDRMDGQGYTNIVTAEMKARTAMLTREPSKATMNRVERDPNQEGYEVQLGFYPVAGGLPIVVGKQIIGFVGAGGFRPNPPTWSDEICVHKAMEQVLGPGVPPLVEDVPEKRERPSGKPTPVWGSTKAPKSALPAEWVVSGPGAAHTLEANDISLAAAKNVAKGCREYAESHGQTASIYILDNAGLMTHMERMDGELPNDMHTALLKAQTAIRLHEPTSLRGVPFENADRIPPRNVHPNGFNFFLASGGIPIAIDGQTIGSVGVSTSDHGHDEDCAIAGLKSAFGDRALVPIYGAAPARR
jgi:uncharacterized protein GlcG (DUF336 family)